MYYGIDYKDAICAFDLNQTFDNSIIDESNKILNMYLF